MRFFLLLSLLFISLVANSEQIKVGTIGDPPYVIWSENEITGYSVALWSIIAQRLRLETEFKHFDSLGQALQALNNHHVDLLVGPINVTPELAENFAYTQPYHRVQLGAVILKKSLSYWQHIRNIVGGDFYFYPSMLALLLLLSAFFMWIFERKTNKEQFRADPKNGLSDSIWFALSTMSSNGYVEKVPVSWKGRILATLWMVLGTFIFASITASLTTFLSNKENIHKKYISDELYNKKIIVTDQAVGDLIRDNYKTINYLKQTMARSFAQLEKDEVYSIIGDKVLLRYHIQEHPKTQAVLLNTLFTGEQYAFLFNNFDAKYFRRVNEEVIRAVSDGSMNKIEARWIK